MKESKKKNSKEIAPKDDIESRLEALIGLTAGALRTVAKDTKSKQVRGAENKAIAALSTVGVSQVEIGKLLGVDIHRINDVCKKPKNK